MINPLPKNRLFATLDANEVAGIIAGFPEEYRGNAYRIYFGTVNHCSTIVDETMRIYAAGGSWVHRPETDTIEVDEVEASAQAFVDFVQSNDTE